MDLFDGEPYADLMPRPLRRSLGWALLISIVFIPAARNWILDQAQQHVVQEVRPLLNQLAELPESSPPASNHPGRRSEP
jgi:hypothetical protein